MIGMRIGSVVFNGRSGEKYCFEVWPMETRFKPMAAVYFVTKREAGNGTYNRAGHEHMFLGHTPDISGPLGTDTQLAWFDKHGANCVCVYLAESASRRMAIQQDLEAEYPTTFAERNERRLLNP
jgi:hypothetical protein